MASGGYIIGFVAAAWLTGFLCERGYGSNAWALPVLLAGNALVYVPGLIQLSLFAPEGKTLEWACTRSSPAILSSCSWRP